MYNRTIPSISLLAVTGITLALTACGEVAQLPLAAGMGANPQLPPPHTSWFPTVNIASATGWPSDSKPLVAPGLAVNAFATGLDHPRWLYVLPNGDVLVAETNTPAKPSDGLGIKDWLTGIIMDMAGAGGASANRISLLRDADGDGVAEMRTVFIEGLNSPFGMTLINQDFYVANTDALLRFTYQRGDLSIRGIGTKVVDLPAGPINHHWTKNLIASRDGSRIYVTVGSNSNIAENGMDQETGRAAIWEVDPKNGNYRIYASGLRNPNGLGWEPDSETLWTVVNERDEIGSDLVPDYLTSVTYGDFFGWPYSYFGQHVDDRVQPQRPDLVAKAKVPDYALGPHTASLGLVFSTSTAWPAPYDNGVFIAQHGSWNRDPRSGYEVVFVPFKAGKPFGNPFAVLAGFVNEDGDAYGRPVGVAINKQQALLVADDVGNTVWRVTTVNNPVGPKRLYPAER